MTKQQYLRMLKVMDKQWLEVMTMDKSDTELLSSIEAIRTVLEARLALLQD